MQQQLSLFETSPADGAVPVWPTLDEEQRALVVAMLARLIAKAATAAATATNQEQTDHE